MLGHYLMFNRNCAEALEFYKQAFGAEIIEIRKYGDMPPNPAFPIADSDKELVLHARVSIAGDELMCADSSANDCENGSNMYITITTTDEAYVKKAWDILQEDAEVYMELTPSFFASLHGSLRDKFGINWMFSALKMH